MEQKQTNPNGFGEGDSNLPHCECKLIYQRIRNVEKQVASPQEDAPRACRGSQRNERTTRILGTDS